MFQVTVDATSHRIEVDFIGNYSDIDQSQFSRDLRAAVPKAKGAAHHFDLLVDFSRVPVMPQDRTSSAREEIEWCVANGLRRSANVMSSTIAKMQVERLAADDRFRTFTDRAAAIAWLRSPA